MDDTSKPKPAPKKKQVMDIAGPAGSPKIQRFGGKSMLLETPGIESTESTEPQMTEKSPSASSKTISPKHSELTIVDHTADPNTEPKNPDDLAKEIEALAKSMETTKPSKKENIVVEVKTKKLSEFKDEQPKTSKPAVPKTEENDSTAEKITVKTTPKVESSPEVPTPETPKIETTADLTPEPEKLEKPDEPAESEAPASAEPELAKSDEAEKTTTPAPTTGTNTSGEPSVNMQPTGFIFPKAPQVDGESSPLKEQATAAKAELQDPKIFDTKEYHVPIHVSRHNRKKSKLGSIVFWFLLILLLVAGVLGLVKVGIIHTSIQIPFVNK